MPVKHKEAQHKKATHEAGQQNKITAELYPEKSFQDLIMALQTYWARLGCAVLQPYDMEVGAGTFHPATILRALGRQPWRVAYTQPSRRPTDGRYGDNPFRLHQFSQFQVLLKPSPLNLQELYLDSLCYIGIDPLINDLRFVEDNWESPTLGAWGLGWECWCDGMEVSQFTYFQQVAGYECVPVSGELTYGLERLAMYIQGVDNVFAINFNGLDGDDRISYGDIFQVAEREYSCYSFDYADTQILFRHFDEMEASAIQLLEQGRDRDGRNLMVQPAYDQCLKANHTFNLLDARGVISVTERQNYILRIRKIVHHCATAWLENEEAGDGAIAS